MFSTPAGARYVSRMSRLASKLNTSRKLSTLSSSSSFSSSSSSSSYSASSNYLGYSLLGVGAGLVAGVALNQLSTSVEASDAPHPPHYPWYHRGKFSAYDTAGIRRGFEVYRQVCSSCHSLEYKSYRELIGVSHTEEQAKALARSVEVTDGPNEQGEMFQRPGKLFDKFPKPYPNEEFARYINGGAIPPDLSLMVLARHGGEDYVFSILTGYKPAPAGVTLRSGLNYNVYFPGNAISMAPPLSDGQIDNEDGTPATVSQMAKDVVTFLAWCAMPEQDQRKKIGAKAVTVLSITAVFLGLYKRRVWASLKTQKVSYADQLH